MYESKNTCTVAVDSLKEADSLTAAEERMGMALAHPLERSVRKKTNRTHGRGDKGGALPNGTLVRQKGCSIVP